jgi:hypothetical protein
MNLDIGLSGLVASSNSTLLSPILKKEVVTPSLSTFSVLYAGMPNNFLNNSSESFIFLTAMPM